MTDEGVVVDAPPLTRVVGQLWTAADLAAALDVSVDWIEKKARAKEIPVIRLVSGAMRWTDALVLDVIEALTERPGETPTQVEERQQPRIPRGRRKAA